MAWIESHVEIGDHPKTYELAELLEVGVAQAVGHLHLLWHFAIRFASDGSLNKFSDLAIARGAKWGADPKKFVEAIQKTGWLNKEKNIHDWEEYAGRYINERRRWRRANKQKKQRGIPKNSTRLPRGYHAVTASNITLHNITLPNTTREGGRIEPFPPLMELWNSKANEKLPKAKMLSKDRSNRIRLRMAEHPDIAFWEDIINRINASKFCNGGNDRGWVATFDWLISNQDNAIKVFEGKYNDRNGQRTSALEDKNLCLE